MTFRYVILLLLAAVLLPWPAHAQTFFTARLTTAQETGDVAGEATGTAALALTPEGLRFTVTVDGLTGPVAAAHFHRGEIGTSGSVVRGITFEGNTAAGVWTATDGQPLTDELVAALLAGELYLNVHTGAYPAGELRGQVRPVSGAGLSAALTPAQEMNDVQSDGSGTAVLQLTDAGLLYYVTVAGLTGEVAAAHFHRAEAGENGSVVRGITFDGHTAFGLWTATDGQPLTDELVAVLMTGGLYLNVHTAQYAAGEIRGQVRPSGGWGFTAVLDPGQEGAGVTSEGRGTGSFTLTDAGLVYRVTVDGLTGDVAAAHFHRGAAGTSGPVVRGISFEGNTAAGLWTATDNQPLTGELIRALLAGELYVNVHTAQYPAGEVRGQVLLDAGTHLTAALTAAQEPGDVESSATGTAALTLTDAGLAYRVTVHGLTGEVAAAHFHRAEAGENGSVVRGITFEGNTAAGVWTAADGQPLTDELVAALLAGELYLNVHTGAYPAGELRGQVHVEAGASLRAVLTNEQEPAEVAQEGGGTAALTLTEAGLLYRVTVAGLTGEVAAAHFHRAAVGENGSVVRGITFEGNTAAGVWTATDGQPLTDELVAALMTGGLYLNVHTAQHAAGEVRGQVEAAGGVGAAVQLDPGQETGLVTSDGRGTASLTLTGAGLLYDATVAGLTGEIAAAHFHHAAFGLNGPVVRAVSFEGPTAAGLWRPADAQPLTGDAVQAFFAGDLYLNVHTVQYPAGEVRGQILAGLIVSTGVEAVGAEVPAAFVLAPNYPNPFNPSTRIGFALPHAAHAVLTVYDLLGRRVAVLVDEPMAAGRYRVTFDARDLPSGLYTYRLEAGALRQTRTMLLVK